MTAFATVFGTMHQVDWWQECLRALVVFVYGLVLLRVSGRRTFGRWSALDIVISIVLGSSLSRALTGTAPFAGTLAAMTLLVVLHRGLGWAVAKSAWISAAIEGLAVELVRAGDRNKPAMVRSSVSETDLQEALRGAGIQRLAQAQLIMLEPSGKITVLKQG